MRRWSAPALACLVALSVLGTALPVLADSAFGVSAKLTFLGNLGPNGEQRYRYDYTVTNNTVTPELGAFQVFFNSDPVTLLPTGDKATLVSFAAPLGWESVTEMLKNVDGQWSLNWDWDYASGLDVVPGTFLAGFSVVFDWNDPNTVPPAQHVQVRNGDAHSGVSSVAPSVVSGNVTGSCGASPTGLQGITVDLYSMDAQGMETLVASVGTDAAGHFSFGSLPLGSYEVVIVTPLGYLADANSKLVSVNESGASFAVNFALTCQAITADPRTIGYWKHQVNCYLTGKGSPQESLADMVRYIDLILTHFNQNITNPVIIYVPEAYNTTNELMKLDQLLTVNKNATMNDRAKQQLLALLLNVVSGKIAQTQKISPNGATVSQAITYCNDLIQDAIASNDEAAKTIADMINNGQTVPSGKVPSSTRIITYSMKPAWDEGEGGPVEFGLGLPSPNPSRGTAIAIRFGLARADQVDLRVFDVTGRLVKTLARGSFAAGPHRMTWDGTDDSGARVERGIYFYRLVTEEGTLSRSVTLQR
jgi:hypothetical protein